jgi:mannose-6-phosphate isomerase-like protein (cupin superfamily)
VHTQTDAIERFRSLQTTKRWLGRGLVLATVAVMAVGCGHDRGSDESAAADTGTQPAHTTHDTEAHATSEVRIVRADSSPTTLMGADLVHCIATAEQTGGGYSFLEIDIPAGGGPAAPHQHPSAEWFYILSGTASIQVGEVQTDIGPGDYFHIPPATMHTFTATTDLRLVAGYSPGGEEGRLFCPS